MMSHTNLILLPLKNNPIAHESISSALPHSWAFLTSDSLPFILSLKNKTKKSHKPKSLKRFCCL